MGTHPIFESDFDCLTVQNCPDWSKMANIGEIQKSGDFNLTPMSEDKVKSNSANWPLLLKGWDQLNVRSSHFTPIPAGCSPLQRPIEDYVRSVQSRGCRLDPTHSQGREDRPLGHARSQGHRLSDCVRRTCHATRQVAAICR